MSPTAAIKQTTWVKLRKRRWLTRAEIYSHASQLSGMLPPAMLPDCSSAQVIQEKVTFWHQQCHLHYSLSLRIGAHSVNIIQEPDLMPGTEETLVLPLHTKLVLFPPTPISLHMLILLMTKIRYSNSDVSIMFSLSSSSKQKINKCFNCACRFKFGQ